MLSDLRVDGEDKGGVLHIPFSFRDPQTFAIYCALLMP